jgi:hypothetical protein
LNVLRTFDHPMRPIAHRTRRPGTSVARAAATPAIDDGRPIPTGYFRSFRIAGIKLIFRSATTGSDFGRGASSQICSDKYHEKGVGASRSGLTPPAGSPPVMIGIDASAGPGRQRHRVFNAAATLPRPDADEAAR